MECFNKHESEWYRVNSVNMTLLMKIDSINVSEGSICFIHLFHVNILLCEAEVSETHLGEAVAEHNTYSREKKWKRSSARQAISSYLLNNSHPSNWHPWLQAFACFLLLHHHHHYRLLHLHPLYHLDMWKLGSSVKIWGVAALLSHKLELVKNRIRHRAHF
jgi:hypothetical protein